MAREVYLKQERQEKSLKDILSDFDFFEDKRYDQITVKYLDKWIWIFYYPNHYANANLVVVEFSKDFYDNEISDFVEKLQEKGLTIDEGMGGEE